jgi:hypothetical protein
MHNAIIVNTVYEGEALLEGKKYDLIKLTSIEIYY